jgi:hypothetical protein
VAFVLFFIEGRVASSTITPRKARKDVLRKSPVGTRVKDVIRKGKQVYQSLVSCLQEWWN